MRRWVLQLLWSVFVSAVVLPSTAGAQYFGRNKVQYHSFDFRVLETEHFDIYYYPEEYEAAQIVGRMAERWYARLSQLLGHELHRRQPIIIYASHPHFEQTNAILGDISEATGGVTELFKRRVVLPLAGPLEETDHVLGHELAHAFQFDITGDPGRVSERNLPVALRLPLWFIEGMAEYLSVGPVDAHTAMWMREAARGDLPSIAKLDDPRFFPYRYGQALWAYVAGRFGDDAVGNILKTSRRVRDARLAIERVTGVRIDSLSNDWHAAMRELYDPLLAKTDTVPAGATVLLSKESGGGELNVAPALSPDGQKLVFLSERELFSIDVFLADATTGRVVRRIAQTALDPHFESLQFINSAGAWDHQGQRFVVGAVTRGRPALSIFDVEKGERIRDIVLPNLGEIFNPTWSPDGRRIAFSAIVGGLSDLFAYDLEADTLLRLTSDPYSDLHPAWSPDGSALAFVTDRFTTDLNTLHTGEYELALYFPATGEVRRLAGFSHSKTINPQWSHDGKSIYFISDRNGISNIYRLELASGQIFQITNLYSGVTGITDLSPAISVAARTGALAFTVYQRGEYRVYKIDRPEDLSGHPVRIDTAAESANPAALPPVRRQGSQVAAMLANPIFGLPSAAEFRSRDYKPSLSLDYVSEPSLAFAVDRFGTYIGGGASLFWSDMMGNHNLVTMLEFQGSFQDIAALVAYSNLKRRLNWGVAVQQVPYLWGGFAVTAGPTRDTYTESIFRFRQINRDVSGFASYPFNRVQRAEFGASLRNVSFHSEVQSFIIDRFSGGVLADEKRSLPAPEGMNLISASAALVYDNALFGWTGPILGQRYRFEVSPTLGTLDLLNVLGDLRKYVMPVKPFTLAGRIIHFGRYGNGADDLRLSPLYMGYPTLVRGYDFGSFSADECRTSVPGIDSTSTCPVFDQLLGSKILVANLELRFPPLGALGLGPRLLGFLPIDVVAFYDAGVAWTGTSEPWFLRGERPIVSSVGVGLRVNLLGFAIAEIDRVHPYDRPYKGTYWQLSLTQAF